MTRARSLSQLANSNVFSVDADNSRVGIGSTVPTVKLDVGGDMNVSGTLTYEDVTNVETTGIITAAQLVVTGVGATFAGISTFLGDIQVGDKIIHNGDTNTAIRFPEADTFTVETGGSERVRVSAAGSFGVGTSGPEALLDVKATSAPAEIVLRTSSSNVNKAKISKDNSGNAGLKIESSLGSSGAPISFHTNNSSERVRIKSNGNVGIGTVSPSSKLQVVSYGDHGKIRVESSGDGNRAGIEFFRESSAGTGKGGAGIWVESETGNSSGELKFGTASNASLQSLSTRMILDSSGNLGIGTDNPATKLVVAESDSTAADMRFQNSSTGYASNNGMWVGINNNEDGLVYNYHNSPLIFGTNDTERFRIDQDGRLITGNYSTALDTTAGSIIINGGASGGRIAQRGSGSSANTTLGEQFGYWDTNKVAGFQFTGGSDTANKDDGQIKFYTSASGPSVSERLRITQGGNVNIGGNLSQTTYTMQVDGTLNATSNITQNGNALATNGKAIAMALIFG